VPAPHCLSLALAAALLALAAAPAPPAGAQGIESLLPAPSPTPYRGRKVVIDFGRRGPDVTGMTVSCEPGGRERREFNGSHGVLILDGQSEWQYLPAQGLLIKRPAQAERGEQLRPEQLRRALESYDVRAVAVGIVAGRPSRVLEFLPREAGSRPRRRVWVDVQSGLILRTEVYDTESRLSWLSVFEELEYRPRLDPETFTMRVPPGTRLVEAGPDPCLEPAAAEAAAGLPVPLPAYLPAGFARQCIRAHRKREYGEIQVVFGDGLSLLSLFASTRFKDPGGDAHAADVVEIGPWHGRWYDRGLVTGVSWRTPWANLALLGELSRPELQRVAGSVRPSPELSAPAGHP
jgi:outer membrane lipoprotein-sorting protein